MRLEIHKSEERTWLIGAAAAVVAGVLAGAAMKPNFGDDRVLGPQFFAADGSLHEAAYRPDPGIAAYGGRIPDYVIGTDWTRPRREGGYAPPSPRAPADDEVAFTAEDPPTSPMVMTYRTWREPPREASSYPSMDGDARYRSEGWRDQRLGREAGDEPDDGADDRSDYGEPAEPPPA